ncbi:sigma-70 family RNA polymerase sigma factor [Paenibacillus lycopersici]|uniref:Sigma-70 family RNA polymerase sigma factor n=1 Tax=Paenibacillus lycopersici TaxID=2704462 RepID=A0A6C0G8Q0_9BACL|nr:sigma-70 family RNA polymerase sigma factor [Paenibacillus lycopersici]
MGGGRPSAEAAYWSAGAENDIWSAVLRLPRIFREIIILHAHEELSYKELADVLGITEGTVKSRLHRARTKLAKLMKEAGSDVETDLG